MQLSGVVDEVRLYFAAASAEQVAKRHADGSEISSDAVLAVSFDDGSARDHSIQRNNGTVEGGKPVDGKFGKAIQFTAKGKKKGGNSTVKPGDSLVDPKWTQDVPIYVRAMVLGGKTLFIAGPPDIIDEEATFKQLSESDPRVTRLLTKQDDALEGQDGAQLLSVDIETGKVVNTVDLKSLPSWDGLAGANGKLFLSTLDGKVMCFGK
jgi:hypothetical protein